MGKCFECKHCEFITGGEVESFGGHAYVSSVDYDADCKKGKIKEFKGNEETDCKSFEINPMYAV